MDNSSIFIIPTISEDTVGLYIPSDQGEWEAFYLDPDYFLCYIRDLAKDCMRLRSFRYRCPDSVDIYMYEDKLLSCRRPHLSGIQFVSFGSGIGFLEFVVDYGQMSPHEICEFAYRFKKTAPSREHYQIGAKLTLQEAATKILPGVRLFFDCEADFKRECLCYHCLNCTTDREQRLHTLLRLRRSYHSDFSVNTAEDETDMVYMPYEYDWWAGSEEALVNISCPTSDERTNRYIDQFKSIQLEKDYHFMYLLLLNQRYSAIRLIEQVAGGSRDLKHIQEIAQRIVALKTNYAFRIVSGDMIYQEVYNRMYDILNIDNLLKDVEDNESRMEMVNIRQEEKTGKVVNTILSGIAALSIFSAAIDAASLLDRFGLSSTVSTVLATAVALAAIIFGVYFFRKNGQ